MDDSLYFTEQHLAVRNMVREFARSEVAPVAARARREGRVSMGERQEDGRARPARHSVAGRAGRRRPRHAQLHDRDQRDGEGRCIARDHHFRAYDARHVADRELRHQRAEKALRAVARFGESSGRIRTDRAERRQRRRQHANHRGAEKAPLRSQWQQDLHHPRRSRRDLRGDGGDRPGQGYEGNQLVHRDQGSQRSRQSRRPRNRTRRFTDSDARIQRGKEGRQARLESVRYPRR